MENKINWVLDPNHSEITFRVKHLMITNVKGEFRKFDAKAQSVGKDFNKASVEVTIDPSSIFTNNDDRDNHLRSAEFFDAANNKEITFKGTSLNSKGGDQYELKGNLTMRGVTKEITLNVEFGGISKDPWGNEKAGFSVSGKLNRKDFGLNWNAALETGGVMVSDEVRIHAEVQFVNKG